ncbi:MAG: response regulator [Chloroflexales bacterium]|nr:response regulator [Chloroflexales bacterium]
MPPLTRILFVEDDPDIQAVGQLALEVVGGFQVAVCSSGAEALVVAPSFAPDLVLLDVMMPVMDGPETLKQLRTVAATQSTPVVFMTAKVQRHEITHYLGLGAVNVIAKPFDPMTLASAITEIWTTHHG